MSRVRSSWWIAVVPLLGIAAAVIWWRQKSPGNAPSTLPPVTAGSPSPTANPLPPASPAPPPSATALLDSRLRNLTGTLRGLPPAARRDLVVALLRELDAASPAARSDAVLAFLRSGLDVPLPGDFVLGPGGWLRDWPTLRLALLDYLSQRDPATAALIAREILTAAPPDAPGEWALAMRELARGHSAEDWPPLVGRRLIDLLRDNRWATSTPRSYLESFDVIVAGRATSLLGELDRLARTGGNAARFAAFLAADRLTLAAPAAALAELNRQPGLFASLPELRAGLFARADVRDPAQLRALEAYFLRGDVGAEEHRAFAVIFPQYDLAISDNLLTPPSRRSLADMQAHDIAALRQIGAWAAHPNLVAWQQTLKAVADRLTQQLAAGGVTPHP
jgi:hypothetical protein